MMKWEEAYKSKLRSIDEVLSVIPSNAVITTPVIPMTPQLFMSQLHKIPEDRQQIQVYTILNPGLWPFFASSEMEGRFSNQCWFYGSGDRAVADQGIKTISYIPNNAHQAIADLTTQKAVDYFVGSASPMDAHGYLTLSCSAFIEKDLIRVAKKVILEVNPLAPRTFGDTPIHISQVDVILEHETPLPQETLIEPTEVEEKIGSHIAEWIQDGSTLQMGIGGVPYAVARQLRSKKNLGVHTEMFTEAMRELYEDGVITNHQKSLLPDKFVCAFVFGTQKLYDFVHNNPAVQVMSGSFTNDPYMLGKNKRMVSINAALMVDLTGQVCSEAIGTRHYSGTGGQLDTHRGAIQSAINGLEGQGFLALRSTAKEGQVSKIVSRLPHGSPVTVPRQDVDCIVTEFGVRRLRGKSVRERAEALIEIAHPDHRAVLRKEASEIGYL